jgi:hypothetical protein
MQLVGIASIRPSFFPHLGDRGGVKAADLGENYFGKHAAHCDSAGATLF